MSLPPGPAISPVHTVAQWMFRPMQFMDECAARFGETFTIRFPAFKDALVMTSNPEIIREVFAAAPDEAHAGEANVFLGPFLGKHSLLLLDGNEHKRQRKLLTPPFHGERMMAYGAAMIAATESAIDRFPVGVPFAIHPEFRAITLRVILRTVFGIEEGARFERLSALLAESLDIAAWPPLLLPPMQVDLGRFSAWGRFQRISAEVDALLFDEIRERRSRSQRVSDDVLSMLIEARDEDGQPMTEDELRDELITLLVAGHETTATALAWAVRWLLERRDVEERLRAEIASVDDEDTLLPDRLAKLPFLDATVRETLRLQPVVPVVGRRLKQPRAVGGHLLPTGTVVLPSIYLAHRRTSVFPNPKQFDPERFLERKPSPTEWFPFGGGMRKCIGMPFALHEMKMVLATVLQRTRLALAPDARVHVVRRAITLTPPDGLMVVARSLLPRGARTRLRAQTSRYDAESRAN